MELPVGIVAVTIATVLLPNLSRLSSRGDMAAFDRTIDWGVRTCLLFGVPAAAALYVLVVAVDGDGVLPRCDDGVRRRDGVVVAAGVRGRVCSDSAW